MNKKLIMFLLTAFLQIYAVDNNFVNIQQNDEYLAFAEQMPEPVGGLEGIYKLIKYPELATKAGVQGKVYVLAFINEDGKVDDVKVVKGIGAGCDEATVEAVKKSKFTPGKSAGKNVKVKMSLQIQFKLT
ncbi:MAG: energy transducer TonB [Ignavibacteriae bacterium]|nr:energy transducer TonB [Ignavibacteriota bacterium]